jgi:CBS domain-containing protein
MNLPMRARDVMTRDVITVSVDEEITVVLSRLIENDISGVPVVDSAGALVGIVTERDCIDIALRAGYFDERGGKVAEFMTAPVETVDADSGLLDIAKRMCTTTHRRFPVLEGGRLVGLISRRDILEVLNAGAWFGTRSSTQGS